MDQMATRSSFVCTGGSTMERFPSAGYASPPGAVRLLPLNLIGWLLHLTVFRRRWPQLNDTAGAVDISEGKSPGAGAVVTGALAIAIGVFVGPRPMFRRLLR